MALFKKENTSDENKTRRYPSPILLLAAAIYIGYMAYLLGKTIFDGSATGAGLVVSWVGMIVFIIVAIMLVYLSFYFNKLSKKAVDEALAEEQKELEGINLDEILSEEEDTNND